MYLVFTRMPGESSCWWLRSLLLCLCEAFQVLINSLVCWLHNNSRIIKKLSLWPLLTEKGASLCVTGVGNPVHLRGQQWTENHSPQWTRWERAWLVWYTGNTLDKCYKWLIQVHTIYAFLQYAPWRFYDFADGVERHTEPMCFWPCMLKILWQLQLKKGSGSCNNNNNGL